VVLESIPCVGLRTASGSTKSPLFAAAQAVCKGAPKWLLVQIVPDNPHSVADASLLVTAQQKLPVAEYAIGERRRRIVKEDDVDRGRDITETSDQLETPAPAVGVWGKKNGDVHVG
jgi:hypothetical protein